MANKDDTIAELRQLVEKLTKRIEELELQLGSDETSIKNNGKKHWIWCLTAASFTLFHIAATRSREVLEELIGDAFRGHLNCDYFSANCSFAWNFDIKAQYCWAHLIRDIRFLLKMVAVTTCRRTIFDLCSSQT